MGSDDVRCEKGVHINCLHAKMREKKAKSA